VPPGSLSGKRRAIPESDVAYRIRGGDMLNVIATLTTPTAHISVNEGRWTEPTEVVSRPDSPTLSLLIHGSGYCAEGAFLDGSARQLCKVGRVIFTPHDREVLGRGTPGKMRVVSCSFDRAYCERIVGSLDTLSNAQLRSCLDIPSALLPAALTRLMTEALHPGFVSEAVVDSLGQAMLVEWSHAVMSREPRQVRGRLLPRHFKIIDDYLAALMHEAPSVAAIAKACGFSERYFAKLFREQMGQSISQYFNAAQIAKAQEYLVQSDLPLKEIAYRLGFARPSNFSDAFHAATGETPGRFRAVNRSPRIHQLPD
jgi:AraC family transcriptional regulator